ncbi:hypothetical protein ZTR_01954 [Talaromyces verruculosus]|nr:hypothetical protein ZTR_01954 [Talaromyces verruculosus]
MIPIEEVQAVFTASYIILFLLACGIYTICLFAYRLLLSPLARFPGPKLAAITSWYEVYFDVVLDGRFMWEIDRMHEEYGPIVRINPFEIHIKDADFYNTLYAGPTKKRDKYSWFLSTGVPTSTFSTADYDHHRLRRGMLSPYLSRAAIRDLESVIQQKVHLLCGHLRSAMEKRAAMELHQCFISLAVDIVSTYAFGKSNGFNLLNAGALDDKWKAGINGSFEKFLLTRHFPWLIGLFRLLPLSISALICPSCRNIYSMETEIETQMISVYLKNRDGISENGIFPEIMNNEKLPAAERMLPRLTDDAKLLMVAGTDAPSQVLAITMFHILHNQSVYRKCQGELEDNIPNPQDIPPLRVLERLPYLTAIIKEGLRISAVVTSRLPRIVPDEKLEYRGWQIPAGVR